MKKALVQTIQGAVLLLSFILWRVQDPVMTWVIIGAAIFLVIIAGIISLDWFDLKFLKGTRPSFRYLGTWRGKISFERLGNEESREITLNITYQKGNISVHAKITGVHSSTITKAIYSDIENSLMYTYISKPQNLAHTTKNPIHYGAVLLKMYDLDSIHGTYFTSRKTDGMILLERVKLKEDTAAAVAAKEAKKEIKEELKNI